MGYSSYIPAQKIEDEAMSVLVAYAQKYKEPITAPVPIEEILDCLYDVTIEAADLRAKYQSDDVLAEFLVGRNRKVILIDQTIHPDFNADKEGRYRFTLGHETGHWILHQHLLASVNTDNLFDDELKPVSVYRTSCKEPKEKQADMFSGYILMPKDLILQEWEAKFGPDHGPENVYEEIREKSERFQTEPENIRCDLAREFAIKFKVSAQTMQIRLRDMGLLELAEPEPRLF